MRNYTNLFFEPPNRKENFFLPSFKLKTRNSSRPSKASRIKEKAKNVLNQEQLKSLSEPVAGLKISTVKSQQKKEPVQADLKNFRFKFRNTPPAEKWNQVRLKELIGSRIKKKEKGEDSNNFMLTGVNFSNMNEKILENDSSANSFAVDLPSLDAKYKNLVSDLKEKKIYTKSSNEFSDSDYIKRRVVYKSK